MVNMISVEELFREYLYPDKSSLRFESIAKVGVSPSGNHRLELLNGDKVVVMSGWRAIVISATDWSF